MKDFDELKPKDRTFKVAGETFTWSDVRPEALESFSLNENGGGVWSAYDQQILIFIPDQKEKWETLRAREENPVTISQLIAVLEWLLEQQTGRPTETPSPSASGRGRTAASSKAA